MQSIPINSLLLSYSIICSELQLTTTLLRDYISEFITLFKLHQTGYKNISIYKQPNLHRELFKWMNLLLKKPVEPITRFFHH